MKIADLFYGLLCMAGVWLALEYLCGDTGFQFFGCYIFGPCAVGLLFALLERKIWDILLAAPLAALGYVIIGDSFLALKAFVVVLVIIVILCIIRLTLGYIAKKVSTKRAKQAPQ